VDIRSAGPRAPHRERLRVDETDQAAGSPRLDWITSRYIPPPEPLRQTFEHVPVGRPAPEATTMEDRKAERCTARVTEEQAARGKRSLKFVDGPGQEKPFTPHVFWQLQFEQGRMIGGFDVRVDRAATFYYQWRQYGDGYVWGPTVRILPGGRLVHDGKELTTIPLDTWVRFEIRCALGDAATDRFDLALHLPGRASPVRFPRLPCRKGFRRLDWVGFAANGGNNAVIYVDDVEVRPVASEESGT
jgi:hypothetical protein